MHNKQSQQNRFIEQGSLAKADSKTKVRRVDKQISKGGNSADKHP